MVTVEFPAVFHVDCATLSAYCRSAKIAGISGHVKRLLLEPISESSFLKLSLLIPAEETMVFPGFPV